MKIDRLSTMPNLELAWRRITTGGNYQYKHFFRDLYCAYEIALADNLKNLQKRVRGGAFKASASERIYVPKSSGLHRPITLLRIEDQIILQAFANLAEKKLQKRRAPLQLKVVFSNLLQKPNSIFFFQRWQETYAAFQRSTRKYYNTGLKWVADFDLAAFYDTISHDLLLRTIYPRSQGSEIDWILECLRTWSSNRASSGYGHGIPQGPLASDFLAECFLLPVDQAMKDCEGYLRYVDDVRLFGKTGDEVRRKIIKLEQLCRERGLIPQTGKFTIKRVTRVEEAMGMLPSIADPQREAGGEELPKDLAREWFYSAIEGRPYRVKDKTRLRYVLFRAQPDSKVLQCVLRLIPRHPEHADAFFAFIGRVGYSKTVGDACLELLQKSPYPYVRGEAWHVLARFLRLNLSHAKDLKDLLVESAITLVKQRSSGNLMEKWGALHFLCVLDEVRETNYSCFVQYQSPLLQALLAPTLPRMAFERNGAAEAYLRRSSFEPGLSICSRLHDLGIKLPHFGLEVSNLPLQVQSTLRELGIIASGGAEVDPIAEILEGRYGLARSKSWHRLLGSGDYVHALGLLKQGEAVFSSGMSYWLACQNSFNHAIFIALQRHLSAARNPGACKFIGCNGQLVDFGVMLNQSGKFSRLYPGIADCFREMNARRNRLPVAHPYEKKTGVKTRYLKTQERNKFVGKLRKAYKEFAKLMP